SAAGAEDRVHDRRRHRSRRARVRGARSQPVLAKAIRSSLRGTRSPDAVVAGQRKQERTTGMVDPQELVKDLQAKGITKIKIGGFDVDGVLRGKYVSLDKLKSAVSKGFGFCDVIFGWDIGDILYDNAEVTGWHTGYPDAHAVLDLSTLRQIPWEPGVVAIL